MKKILLVLITILIYGNCVFNHENNNPVNIDKTIQYQVESAILDTLDDSESKHVLHYMNEWHFESYVNDSLQEDLSINVRQLTFQSYWDISGDTVYICGYFGREGRLGFEMNIINKIPKVYNSISTMTPLFSHTKNGNLERNVNIPTQTSKVTLSDIPDKINPKTIYGFVEFESQEFFEADKYDEKGQEIPNQRNRLRNNMKIYFKANKSDSTFRYLSKFEK